MKNIFKLLLIALMFSACDDEDIFQEDPDSIVIENFFQTEEEFNSALRGVYSRMKTVGYYGGSGASGDFIITGDLLADNLISNPDGRRSNFRSHNWQYNDNTTPTVLYNQAYISVARVNLILDNLDNLEDGTVKDQIRGEALALRASLLFDVARLYSEIPTQSANSNQSIGVAYPLSFDPTGSPSRVATVQETYDLINADLDSAISLIGSANASDKTRFDLNVVRGIISRVALHQGNYQRVIQFAQPVVSTVSPAQASELGGLWTTANSAGVLFELPFIIGDELLDTNFSQGAGTNLVTEYNADKAFYDLYDQATEPERIAAYFVIQNNWIAVNKYIQGSQQQGLNNGRYLRVEEVILNLAEAQYLDTSVSEASALATLDILRNARYSSFTGGETGDALFDAIMLERRKELAFESSDRWFTIKRLQGVSGIPSSYTVGVVRSGNGHLADGTGVVLPEQTLPAGDFRFQLPLQQSWLLENLNLVQNRGY
ncbi:SusD-like starch-binding protein associating with outer membrane [Nonlabens dokdonensis]|uniref:SusD-like starch-binding protein associating with outer membrane n=2 Tax=Nonlabens dokdonensis TaxID=328515 RepID=A0ABX5Q003_9FLAO|nr:RagB/SusD family nutrient uptake outer membrane protein [Nonlabens dokdonensis]AGC75677.1 putative outer membrane receptor protein [Nonlabens dokdonensis DSW-6]PZX43365.1 SusD-like starch-binding protein associating with outer membrane [Nonlabens dokdonensis]